MDKKELINKIKVLVQENLNNKKILKRTREEFAKKGLNINVPNLVWSDSIRLEELNDIEIIAIIKGVNSGLEYDYFKLKDYFSEGEIDAYNNFISSDEAISTLRLNNAIKISDSDFHCIVTAEQLFNIRKNGLVGYFRRYQRAGVTTKTSSGRVIEKIGVNKEGILEMQNRFLDKLNEKNKRKYIDIRPTSIAFTVLLDELTEIEGNFLFKEKDKGSNIGELAITPNFDVENETGLRLIISDGMHRYTALTDAYQIAKNEGKYLDEKIGLYIHLMKPIEAKQYLQDVFRRNDTSIDYLKSIESDIDNEFISKFESESKWLSGHVATSKRGLNIVKNYTEQKTLAEGFEGTDINMTNDPVSVVSREKVASILDNILDYTFINYYYEDMNQFRESIFLNNNIFKLYIRFAARVRKIRYMKYLDSFVNAIENSKELESELNSNSNNLDHIFEELINSVVINNE